MQIRFYIDRKNANQQGEAPIFMSVSYEGRRLIIATQQKVKPENWIVKESRVKEPRILGEVTELDLAPSRLNSFLDTLQATVKNIYNQERERMLKDDGMFSEIPTSFIRDKLNAPKSVDVFKLIEKFMEYKALSVSKGTMITYQTWRSSLRRYNNECKKLNLSSFDNGFETKYAEFSWSIGNKNSIINQHISKTKGFINWVKTGGKLSLKTKGDKDNLWYLTKDELQKIIEVDLTNKTLSIVRDMLIFNCFFGARYEDVQGIEKKNILSYEDGTRYIRFWVKKKKKDHEVALNKFSEPVVKKYEGGPGERLFPEMKTAKYNQHLKKLGRIAGIDETKTKLIYGKGGEPIKEKLKKYELMSSHIARKTFATLAQNLGFTLQQTAAITDHDSKAIEKYYEITQDTQRIAMKKMNSFTFDAPEAEI